MINGKTLYQIIHNSYYHPSFMTNAFYIDVWDEGMYVLTVYADDDCGVIAPLGKQRKMPWSKFKVDDPEQLKKDVMEFMDGDITRVVHSNGKYK